MADSRTVDRFHDDYRKIKIRVFMGGMASTQTGPFTSALIEAQRYFDVTGKTFPITEYLTTELARSLHWGIKEITDWLLDSDIHFILNHIHQGKV